MSAPDNGNGGPPRPTIVITLGPNGPEINHPKDMALTFWMLKLADVLLTQRLTEKVAPKPADILLSGPMPGLRP